MKKDEFIKEHPSLKDKWFKIETDDDFPVDETTIYKCCGCDPPKFEKNDIVHGDEINDKLFFRFDDIHKTQIDKQKVKEVIKSLVKECMTDEGFSCDFAPKIMQQLGIERNETRH